MPARVATVVTVALLADPDLSAWTAKGEVLGTPLVALSWLLRRARPRHRLGPRSRSLAGVCAMTACGFKQSLVGGLVFAAVLLGASLFVGPAAAAPGGSASALRFAVGAALPVLVCVAWLAVTPGDDRRGVVPGGRLPRRRLRGAGRQ